MKRWLAAAIVVLASCSEIGNPVGGGSSELVRTSPSAIGPLTTEVRLVPADRAQTLVAELGDQLDHLDPSVPPGGVVVAVLVRTATNAPRPAFVHLVTDFVHSGGATERRVWVARGEHPRFVAIFGVAAAPTDVRTTTL